MNYIELNFTVVAAEDYVQDIIINELSVIGFDTFEETDFGFKAYIPSADYQETMVRVQLDSLGLGESFSYSTALIPHQNWNELWESNFEPIQVKDTIYVRAGFHAVPEGFKYDLVIEPKMSFGTGHHQTTRQMMTQMLDLDFNQKTVLDMGCGTGILAILAEKLQAKSIDAIEIDANCEDNILENIAKNNCNHIQAIIGDAAVLNGKKYDIILANINRNILLADMEAYVKTLNRSGKILFSGFYTEDLDAISACAVALGLVFEKSLSEDNWCCALYKTNF